MDKDESTFMSATNHELTIVGQTTTFVKLDSIKHPVKIQFLVCSDDGDEGLLSFDTLKELSIVPRDFPLPMDRAMRETKLNRVKEAEMDELEVDHPENLKLVDIEERIGLLRSKLNFKKVEEEDFEEGKKCEDLKKRSVTMQEILTREDRLNIPPIKIDLVEGHERIETFKPKTPMEVSPFLEPAAKRELSRMVEAGMLEEIDYWTVHLSRGVFVEKPGKEEVQARLVADSR